MAEYDTDKHILTLLESLQSRILGLDMCLKGLVLIQILDSGSFNDKLRRANVLRDTLVSIKKSVENEPFMKGVNEKSFFSSINSLVDSINNVEKQLQNMIMKAEENGAK